MGFPVSAPPYDMWYVRPFLTGITISSGRPLTDSLVPIGGFEVISEKFDASKTCNRFALFETKKFPRLLPATETVRKPSLLETHFHQLEYPGCEAGSPVSRRGAAGRANFFL